MQKVDRFYMWEQSTQLGQDIDALTRRPEPVLQKRFRGESLWAHTQRKERVFCFLQHVFTEKLPKRVTLRAHAAQIQVFFPPSSSLFLYKNLSICAGGCRNCSAAALSSQILDLVKESVPWRRRPKRMQNVFFSSALVNYGSRTRVWERRLRKRRKGHM